MKKQYLIGLLGLIAISIPIGTSLLNTTNSSIELSYGKDVETGIVIEDSSHVYVEDDSNSEVPEAKDMIDAITLNATYDPSINKEITITQEDSLLIYYSDADPLKIKYSKINEYFANDKDNDKVEEGFKSGDNFVDLNDKDKQITGFEAEIDYFNDILYLPPIDSENDIWEHEIKDSNPYNLSTTATWSDGTNTKNDQEYKIGSVSIELGFKDAVIESTEAINITSTTATIKYDIATPGRDVFGKDATIEEVALYEGPDKGAIKEKQLGIQENPRDGIIEVSELNNDTNYEDAEIRVKSSNNGTVTAKVENLRTPLTDPSIATIEPTTNLNDTSATINYDVVLAEGETVESATLYENEDAIGKTPLGIQENTVEGNKGNINITGLTPNTNYDDAILVVEFNDDKGNFTSTQTKIIEDLHTIPVTNNLSGWAIFGIIIGTLLIFGILVWIAFLLYKESNDNKKKRVNIERYIEKEIDGALEEELDNLEAELKNLKKIKWLKKENSIN